MEKSKCQNPKFKSMSKLKLFLHLLFGFHLSFELCPRVHRGLNFFIKFNLPIFSLLIFNLPIFSLLIFNLLNGCGRRNNPVTGLSKCPTTGYAQAVYVLGSCAYIADGQAGLQVMDISNPSVPRIVGHYDTDEGYAQGIWTRDTIAYIANGSKEGLIAFNVCKPESIIELPTVIGFAGDYAYDIYVTSRNDSVFAIISCKKECRIINVTTFPANPVSKFATPGDAYGIYGDSAFAYIADGEAGLQIVDIKQISNPTIIGSCVVPGKANDVYVLGNYAYMSAGTKGLQIVDISNLSAPKIVGSCSTPGYANDVFVFGNYTYVADKNGGVQIIDVSNPIKPKIVRSIYTPYAYGVFVTKDYIYVADRDDGLVIISNIKN